MIESVVQDSGNKKEAADKSYAILSEAYPEWQIVVIVYDSGWTPFMMEGENNNDFAFTSSNDRRSFWTSILFRGGRRRSYFIFRSKLIADPARILQLVRRVRLLRPIRVTSRLLALLHRFALLHHFDAVKKICEGHWDIISSIILIRFEDAAISGNEDVLPYIHTSCHQPIYSFFLIISQK
jgi:hypothetical protein